MARCGLTPWVRELGMPIGRGRVLPPRGRILGHRPRLAGWPGVQRERRTITALPTDTP